MSSRAFIGAGDLYINRIVGGVAQGWVGPYECKKFEIKPNVDKKEAKSKGKTSYGQVIETVNLPQPSELTVELPEVNKESLALALLATTDVINQASADVANEAFVAKKDKWVPLSKAQVSAVVVKDQAGVTTYVEGVDYLVNKELGWLKVLGSSVIAEDASLKVSFHCAQISGTLIKGATSTDVRAKFMLDGINQADGLPCICTVHEGVIAADSAFDFLADDFNSVTLPGTMKTPAGFNEPFTVALRNAAAA